MFLDKACLQSSQATSAFQIPQTAFSKCSDKVKTRESCSSYYIAMTEKGKGTSLLLAVGIIPIYVDFSSHPKGHSQQSISKYSASFPPDNTSANKPHQNKSISYHQG
ncbi:hypothetical protein ACFX2K_006365 [Malus domestica]